MNCINHQLKKVERFPRVIRGDELYECVKCGHTEIKRAECSMTCHKSYSHNACLECHVSMK